MNRTPALASSVLAVLGALATAVTGCKTGDPFPGADAAATDAVVLDAGPDAVMPDANPACVPGPDDYRPEAGSINDTWPACISDDGEYHPFDVSISTVARVGAYEAIAGLLFTGVAPAPSAFTDARVQYALDGGLESRVARREDEHYPPAMKAGLPVACNTLDPMLAEDAAILAANRDRCVGPMVLQPLLNQAFATGQIATAAPRVRRLAAAQIEGALLRFLYTSVHKEAITCTSVQRDCDSMYAYYTGGQPRSGGLGLARAVRGLDLEAHDRVWDGILGARCWRDLDNPAGVAMDLALRDRAIGQLDAALLRGVAVLVLDRVGRLATSSGDERAAHWELLRVLGPTLVREAGVRAPDRAAVMNAELGKTDPATVDAESLRAAIAGTFPCP